MNQYKITSCRACNKGELQEIIDLGDHYVSDFVISKKTLKKIKVPLKLVLCNEEDGGCGLLQLEHNAPADSMWDETYWYKSSINPTIKADLRDIVSKAQEIINLKKDDLVIDIGCNDGTLLSFYKKNLKKVGFEPSKNVASEAIQKGFKIINNFFNKEDFFKEFGNKKAKIITAISMFYDLEDPNLFLEDINSCLDNEGLFIIQQNYLVKMLENNGVDNICHEHREYYSLRSLTNLLKKHQLEIFDVELNEINGGSIRTYIRKKGSNLKGFIGADKRIEKINFKELRLGLNSVIPYKKFANRVNEIKEKLIKLLINKIHSGEIICGSGASTKGNTILQYFDLNSDLIKAIGDKNSDKFGKMTIGSWIPIDSPENIEKINPSSLFVLIWFFLEDLKKNHKDFLDRGGELIVPFPRPRLIKENGRESLILWASINK